MGNLLKMYYYPKITECVRKEDNKKLSQYIVDKRFKINDVSSLFWCACAMSEFHPNEPYSILLLAASLGNPKMLALLWSNGANADIKTPNYKLTALILAAIHNKADNVSALCSLMKCEKDHKDSTYHQNTALHYACMFGYREVVVKLLEMGADASVINRNKKTPAEVASYHQHPDIVILIEDAIAAKERAEQTEGKESIKRQSTGVDRNSETPQINTSPQGSQLCYNRDSSGNRPDFVIGEHACKSSDIAPLLSQPDGSSITWIDEEDELEADDGCQAIAQNARSVSGQDVRQKDGNTSAKIDDSVTEDGVEEKKFLNDLHQSQLRNNYVQFLKSMNPDLLSAHLFSTNDIDYYTLQYLQSLSNDTDKNKHILKLLMKGTEKMFDNFKRFLKDTDQLALLSLLEYTTVIVPDADVRKTESEWNLSSNSFSTAGNTVQSHQV